MENDTEVNDHLFGNCTVSKMSNNQDGNDGIYTDEVKVDDCNHSNQSLSDTCVKCTFKYEAPPCSNSNHGNINSADNCNDSNQALSDACTMCTLTNEATSSVCSNSSHGNKVDIDVMETKTKLARSEKKRLKHIQILEHRKENRKQKKQERKERIRAEKKDSLDSVDFQSKREIKDKIRDKLTEAMLTGQRVCVDLSMENIMSAKEIGKLAQQLGRLYGVNRHADIPAHLYFCGLDKTDGRLYPECIRKNSGFENYIVQMTEQACSELFNQEEIVYLSPDAEEVLTDVCQSKVYVLGGLVDESVNKNVTSGKCETSNIRCARLPIPEYMDKVEQSSHSSILAINQVFEILTTYLSTKDWRTALSKSVPKRKGYVIK